MTGTKWGQRAERRVDILRAARARLAEAGFDALNMRGVARDAGVSAGTVYTYFSSKEELFATLYAQRIDEFHAEIRPACASAERAEDLFVTIASAYLDVYRVFGRELNVWAGLLDGSATSEHVAKPLIAAAEVTLATVGAAMGRLASARGASATAEPDAHLVLPFLWATITGLAEHFTSRRRRIYAANWDDLVRFAARTVVAGLDTAHAQPEPGAPPC